LPFKMNALKPLMVSLLWSGPEEPRMSERASR
jgi:hypothetical protein